MTLIYIYWLSVVNIHKREIFIVSFYFFLTQIIRRNYAVEDIIHSQLVCDSCCVRANNYKYHEPVRDLDDSRCGFFQVRCRDKKNTCVAIP